MSEEKYLMSPDMDDDNITGDEDEEGGSDEEVEDTGEEAEEEQSGYKGLPAEIPPKGKYVPPEENTSANSVYVLTEHTSEEDTYEKPICKRLEETDTETEPVSHGLI